MTRLLVLLCLLLACVAPSFACTTCFGPPASRFQFERLRRAYPAKYYNVKVVDKEARAKKETQSKKKDNKPKEVQNKPPREAKQL